MLAQLVALYLDRLPAELAAREASRLAAGELHFAWEGPLTLGARHYYRVQGDDLLIEYDTTDDGNHAHTVLRRPRSDFGDDVLAAHYQQAHRGALRTGSPSQRRLAAGSPPRWRPAREPRYEPFDDASSDRVKYRRRGG